MQELNVHITHLLWVLLPISCALWPSEYQFAVNERTPWGCIKAEMYQKPNSNPAWMWLYFRFLTSPANVFPSHFTQKALKSLRFILLYKIWNLRKGTRYGKEFLYITLWAARWNAAFACIAALASCFPIAGSCVCMSTVSTSTPSTPQRAIVF